MNELVHDPNCIVCRARAGAPRRLLQGLALFAAGLCVTTGILDLRPGTHARPAPAVRTPAAPAAPVLPRLPVAHVGAAGAGAAARARDVAAAELGRDAAVGDDRSLVLDSPGGVFAAAARVARWQPLVARATRGSGISPHLVEAVVLVESSGRADVSDGAAVGLTQLAPSTARRFGLHVDLRHDGRLTRQIARTWNPVRARQLRRWRARYDERYAPTKELRATVAYLESARQTLGRTDLAVQAYHDGVGALRGMHVPFAALYARSGRFDDYYFRVRAAERVMRLWRHDGSALRFEVQQQLRKNSAEEYLHPLFRTHRFGTPNAILHAWGHTLRAIPLDARATHIAVGGSLGAEARKLGRSRRLYRALRPQALDVLLYIGKQVYERSHVRKPLVLTSAVRDLRYQRTLMRVNVNAARTYSLHTTGYAFDLARAYANTRQARAFQFVLDRLEAANAIAYIRESAAIHVAVASDAPEKLQILQRLR